MTEQKKYQYEWLYRAVVISLLTAGLIGGMNYVPKMVRAVEDLTFDSVILIISGFLLFFFQSGF